MKSTNLFRRIYLWHIDQLRKPAWILAAIAVVVNAAAHTFHIWTKITW